MLTMNSHIIYASNLASDAEERWLREQTYEILSSIDEESLMLDAMNNVVDDEVPQSIKDGVIVDSIFTPVNGVSQDDVEITVNTTLQKVGEVRSRSGVTSNVYVAAAEFEVKEDVHMSSKSGVKAWAFIYWVDNQGIENELYAAAAQWDPGDYAISDRVVEYGVCDLTGLSWNDGPTTKYPTDNYPQYFDYGKYTGFKFKCQTEVNIVNIGTLKAFVTSSWTT